MFNSNAQPTPSTLPALNATQQSIVTIAALTATGDLDSLKTALNAGLDAGLTVNEIKEILVQLYAYCGFPRSLNGLNSFRVVLEARKAKGIHDQPGKEITTPLYKDKYEKGRQTLETLTKTPQSRPAPGFGEFAPRIDAFLKEHLFADVFDSEVLDHQHRELVTIAALAAMPGVEPQLQSHLSMGRNTGLTDSQYLDIAQLIGKHIGTHQSNGLRKLLQQPLLPNVAPDLMVRISEITIDPAYAVEYYNILKEEAAASVQVEPGVLAIFPMHQPADSSQLKIVEIYANEAAYKAHLKTPHFQLYKTSTLKMVKSLKLVDMRSVDPETMAAIFRKIQ